MNRPLLGLLVFITLALVGFHMSRFYSNDLPWSGIEEESIERTGSVEQRIRIELPIKGRLVNVELAVTDEQRRRGLSGRESMSDDEGMLFVFPESGLHPFWMNEMHFPIDMIWLKEGVVVEIAANMPAPKFAEFPATHTPKAEADMVLELTAGGAERYGLDVGTNAFAPEIIP